MCGAQRDLAFANFTNHYIGWNSYQSIVSKIMLKSHDWIWSIEECMWLLKGKTCDNLMITNVKMNDNNKDELEDA